jgi:protein O-GlcNAc transferase
MNPDQKTAPENSDIHPILEAARRHHQAGRSAQAEAMYRRILAIQPEHAEALHSLGILAFAAGQLPAAASFFEKAMAADPRAADYACNLGAVLEKLNRLQQAEHAYRWAIQINPELPQPHNNLSNLLLRRGDLPQAFAEAQRALDLQPKYAEALCNRANILEALNRLDEAIADFEQTIHLRPEIVEAHAGLVRLLARQRRYDQAIEVCRQAIRRWPDMAAPYVELGVIFQNKNDPQAALEQYIQALQHQPNLALVHNYAGMCFISLGFADRAIPFFRQAVQFQPDSPQFHSDLIYASLLDPDQSPQMIAQEQREWNRRHAKPLVKFIRPHENNRSPDRLLRIGYLSPNFYRHVVGWSILPLLEQHNRDQFQVVCYSTGKNSDNLTQRLRQFSTQWRDLAAVSDQRAADIIRHDKIDILVDLALHTIGNRLPLLARKPVPIQVAYLGSLGGTGLETIDYLFSDRFIDPPDSDTSVYSEQIVRLPDCYWVFRPDDAIAAPGDPGPPPALGNGFVTFGSLNNFCKVSAPTIHLWARLLAAVPRSRLLLHAFASDYLEFVRQRFSQAGVAPDRLEFVGFQGHADYLKTFGRIDIALDPFPYNGGVTTCNCLWMGVPTVSLLGRGAPGRAGYSILTNVGLPELVASDHEQYLQIAKGLAGDLARVGELRRSLRQRMLDSPLTDPQRFTHGVESAYRQMWRTWCQSR